MKNSIKNCLTVFQRDPLLRGAVSYNILSERVDIVKPLGWERTSATLTDMDMKYLLLYLEEHYGLTSEKKVENAIQIVANENRYHPVRDYLNSLQWDGTERIRYALHHFLGADTDEYTFEALKLFMMGAIRRVFQPGSKFEVMLCLVGGQGAGKSTFFRLLAVKDEWFSDDLKKLDDENVYRKLQGHWIMEMSEMIATANARSIEEIKSFLSRQKETYKVPYETHPADRLRQCVFGGTTNRQDFLPRDRTGNRRFIPVTVYPERAEVHILDDEAAARTYISQMWAEAMTIYHMPIYKELLKRVDAGDFGELRVIQMNFGSYKEYDMKNRFFNRNLAGGALLDIGVYALSFVRMFLSSCPDRIASQVKLAPTGVDEQAGILLMNPKQEMATVTLSLHAKQPKRGMLSFDKAYVEMYEYPRGQKAVITYTEDGHTEELRAGVTADALVYEVEDMERAIAGQPEVMKLNYTEDVMYMMTEIRKQWGLTYPEEE